MAGGAEVTDVEIRLVSELRLTASQPSPGQAGVPAGRTTISLQFSEPLAQVRGRLILEAEVIPEIPGFDPQRSLRPVQNQPRRVQAQVNLQPDTDYRMVIFYAQGVSGAELTDVTDIPWTTRTQLVSGKIDGTVTTSDASTPKGSVILGDLEEERRIAEVKVRQDGTYSFQNVPPGSFGIFAELTLEDGRVVRGFLDADPADGRPDAVALQADQELSGQDFTVNVPAAAVPGQAGPNVDATFSFDFGGGTGDGGDMVGEISAGEEFSVALYGSNMTSLVAYEIQVNFNSNDVTVQSVKEGSGAEGSNFLKQNAGLVAFIGKPGEGSATLSGVILGPSDQVAPSGGGLLGVLEFVALLNSGETELSISSAQLSALVDGATVSDSVLSDAKGTVSAVELTKSMGLTAAPSIIPDDGSTASTITAQVLDLEGVLQSDDSTTVVTFSTSSGQLSSETVTATGGVATTTLTSNTAGTVTVTASVEGALDATVSVVVQATGGAVVSGERGPIALDMNLDTGDQEQAQSSTTPSVGDTVVIDVAVTKGAEGANGFKVELKYDSEALEYLSFVSTDVFAGGLLIPLPGTGSIQINVALIATSASKDAGSAGRVSFKVKDGFSTTTSVVLATGEFSGSAGTQVLDIGAGGATAIIGGKDGDGEPSTEPTPDIDGDGVVGFSDFVLFAQKFGSSEGQPNFDPKCDLDLDKVIGFGDFVLFAQAFGTTVKPAVLSKPTGQLGQGANGKAGLTLLPQAGETSEEVEVVVRLTDAVEVSGYNLRFSYDASALEWVGSEGVAASRFASNGQAQPALSASALPGEVVLADVLRSDAAIQGEGDLVRLRFRVLDGTVPGSVEIVEALVSDGLGRINELVGAHMTEVRALPGEYALNQNYPNPFNPDTQIPYQLPESGEVFLAIYNLLGQQVAVLAQGRQEAGFYRAVWDGRDAYGRSVSSGIYLVRMVSGDFSNVKKMVLLK